MEFNETLSRLQGTICSLERRGLLNEKGSWKVVVKELENITKDVSDDVKSEIVFFMVLNTNLSVCKELEEDKFVGHFANIFKFYIDKKYLITYICHLNLEKYLFKLIENCPGIIGIELMDAFIDKMGEPSFSQEFHFNHFYQLWECIFRKMCKISVKKLQENGIKFVSYFSIIYKLIEEVIMRSMSIKGSDDSIGLHLYNFFQTFLIFLELMEKENFSDDPLYELSVELETNKHYNNEGIKEKCLNLVLEGLPNILQMFTLDLWLNFSDSYFHFDSKNSIQLLIGIKVENIVEKLKALNVPSVYVNVLSNFAINKFEVADLDEIISNVRKKEKEWIKVLIEHPSVTEEKSLLCLIEIINMATEYELNMILNFSFEYICKEKRENLELMKKLFLTSAKKLKEPSKWLEKVFENYKPGLLTTSHTLEDITMTFNKISKEKNIPTEELLILFMQSPVETIKKISTIAVYNSLPTEKVIEVLKMFKNPASLALQNYLCNADCNCNFNCNFIDDVIINSILSEDLTNKENQLLIKFIKEMEKENILGPFFPNLLLHSLKMYLEKNDFEKAVLCLSIVRSLEETKLFAIDKVVLLVFLSQVLGHFSWDLEKFSTEKADGRDLVVSIAQKIIKKLERKENDSKLEWARREILKCSEVNRICFCGLWFDFGKNWPNSGNIYSYLLTLAHSTYHSNTLEKFFSIIHHPEERRSSILLSLIVILPVLTFQEWNSIFENLISLSKVLFPKKNDYFVVDIFASFLYFLSQNVKKSKIYSCYEYCLRNFVKLVKRFFPKMNAKALVETFERIIFVVESVEEEEEKKCCWMIISPVLLECVEFLKEKNMDENEKRKIKNLLALSNVKELAQNFAKRFV